jgi:hypothetical protein
VEAETKPALESPIRVPPLLVQCVALLLPFAASVVVYYRFLDQWFFRDDTAWLLAARNPDFLDFLRDAFTLPRGSTPYWRPLADLYLFAM